MRFGIMAMQTGSLIPSGMGPEDTGRHIASFDHGSLVEGLAARGFRLIELGGDLVLFMPHTFDQEAVDRLAAVKEALGLAYTVHLPLWSVEPSTPLGPVREGSVRALVGCIEATQSLAPECFVLHATGALAAEFYRMSLPPLANQLVLRQFHAAARASVSRILAETGIASRQLAIETIEFPFELTLELADELDLSICLDVGHVLVGFSGPIDLFDALEACLPRLAEVHLHDGPWQGPDQHIGYGLDHRPLGAGDLDTARFLDRLAAAEFDGPVIFELTVKEALASLDVVRSMRPHLLGQVG